MSPWGGAYLFDGAACLLLPLLAAQLHCAVDVHLLVVGAKDEEPVVRSKQTGSQTRTFMSLVLEGSTGPFRCICL